VPRGVADQCVEARCPGSRQVVIRQAGQERVAIEQFAPQPLGLIVAQYLAVAPVQFAAFVGIEGAEDDRDADVER
jgi:hypothetical protein